MIIEAEKGVSLHKAVEDLKDSLSEQNSYLDLRFNDINIRVTKNSNTYNLRPKTNNQPYESGL